MSTINKAATFMRYQLDEFKGASRGKSLEFTKFELVRKDLAPMLQRVAQWQQYAECSDRLLKKGSVYILYKELELAKTQADKLKETFGQVDYAATSR